MRCCSGRRRRRRRRRGEGRIGLRCMSDGRTVADRGVLARGQGRLARGHWRVGERGGVGLGLEPESGDTVGALVPVVDGVGWCWGTVRAGGAGGIHRARDGAAAAHHRGVDAGDRTWGGGEAAQRLAGHHGGQVLVHRAVHVHVHVEPPRERLGAEWGGNFGGPVLVRVARVQPVVKGGLHQAVELRAKTRLERLHVALSLAPLGSSIFEPDLLIRTGRRRWGQIGYVYMLWFFINSSFLWCL